MSARAALGLVRTGFVHRRELAASVDAELARWRELASAIPDLGARALALERLDGDSGHARAATMIAALAPPEPRGSLARTILAAELLYDQLDSRTEALAGADPLAEARELYEVFTDSCAVRSVDVPEHAGDRLYLAELANATRDGLARLPDAMLVREHLASAATRAAEAQSRLHASAGLGGGQLEDWARREAADGELGWREHLAGCGASVLCVHALALRAASPNGPIPEQVDRAYFHLAALATLLDGMLDGDAHGGEAPSYTGTYGSESELAEAVLTVADRARALLGALGPQHEMMLAGLIAHYSGLPGAHERRNARVLARLRRGSRAAVRLASIALAPRRRRPHLRAALPLQARAGDEPAHG